MTLAHDTAGSGPAIVFLHAALGDRRMWQPQWDRFSTTNTLVRIDLRGFGESPPAPVPFSASVDVSNVLDVLGIAQAVVVGGSMGGRVALQLAITEPERVTGLLLLCAPRRGHSWSQQVQDFWAVENAALDAGDIDAAVQANLEFWVDGPNRVRAGLSDADRALVAQMQRRSFENALTHPDAEREEALHDLDERLNEIRVPTAVAYGTDDVEDIAEISRFIADQVPGATLHPIADAAHVPSLEQPAICNQLLADLLAQVIPS